MTLEPYRIRDDDPDTPRRLVARLMADRRVHMVARIEDGQLRRSLTMISTLDIAAAWGRVLAMS